MASWNSAALEVLYQILGRTAFVSCVMGFNFNFMLLNLTKHTSYLIYNATLYFSAAVQQLYYEKYGYGQVSIFFYVLFMLQHYVFYPAMKRSAIRQASEEAEEPLVKSHIQSPSENVWALDGTVG